MAKKKRNTSELALEREKFLLQFIGCECSISVEQRNIEEYDKAIDEISCLLQDAIDRGDTNEIKNLRRDLQRCKTEKRLFKRENTVKELAYT